MLDKLNEAGTLTSNRVPSKTSEVVSQEMLLLSQNYRNIKTVVYLPKKKKYKSTIPPTNTV